MSDSQPTIVFVEHVLWKPGTEWDAALEHVAGRFARVSPIDVDAVRSAGPLHAQLDELARWAEAANVDLDRELGRWFDEHLSMHVRPDPSRTRAVRALAAAGPVHAASALPPRPAESIARHAGCWRSISELHANLRTAEALAAIVEATHGDLIAAPPTPLPDTARVSALT